MRNVAANRPAREIRSKFPDDLKPWPCGLCGVDVVWCKGNARKHGTRPVAVEVAPTGVIGDVAIERELLGGLPEGNLYAYETQAVSRYRWHGPVCQVGSHTGAARAPKVRA